MWRSANEILLEAQRLDIDMIVLSKIKKKGNGEKTIGRYEQELSGLLKHELRKKYRECE